MAAPAGVAIVASGIRRLPVPLSMCLTRHPVSAPDSGRNDQQTPGRSNGKIRARRSVGHVEHLHWLGERIGDRLVDKIVLYAGDTAGRRSDGVALIPLAMLY